MPWVIKAQKPEVDPSFTKGPTSMRSAIADIFTRLIDRFPSPATPRMPEEPDLPSLHPEYAKQQKRYEKALELFKEPDWCMAYLLYRKWYYEERYSQGTQTRYYKRILEEIEHMKGTQVC